MKRVGLNKHSLTEERGKTKKQGSEVLCSVIQPVCDKKRKPGMLSQLTTSVIRNTAHTSLPSSCHPPGSFGRLLWAMPISTYSGGAILLRSTSLRKSLCRACSAVQRLLGSRVSIWSSRSRAAEGMLVRNKATLRGCLKRRGRNPMPHVQKRA